MQVQHIQAAQQNRALLASANHGHPAILATPRPADFHAAAARAPEAQPHAAEPAVAPHEVNRPGVASPHPVNRTAAPHPVNREAAPESSLAPRTEAARPMAAPHPIAAKPMEPHQMAPRPMEPRPMAAPHPMEARPMAQPHPAAASHPAPAPHPAPAGHEDKPQR
jgi:hypothetical protein